MCCLDGSRGPASVPRSIQAPLACLLPSLNSSLVSKGLWSRCAPESLCQPRPELPPLSAWVLSGLIPTPFHTQLGSPAPSPHIHRSEILASRILWDPPPVPSPERGSPSLHKLHPYPGGAHFLKPAALSGSNRRPSISSFLTICQTSFMSFFRLSKSLLISWNNQRGERVFSQLIHMLLRSRKGFAVTAK